MWRILDDGRLEAAWNMAVDEALFRHVCAGSAPPTIRLYQWREISISIGRFQNQARTLDIDALEKGRYSLVRRITGGRGIVHGDDLTVALVCHNADLGLCAGAGLKEVYTAVTAIFTSAMRAIGVAAIAGSWNSERPPAATGDCFRCVGPSDLVCAKTGVKLMGGALHRLEDALLLQASVPLNTPVPGAQARHAAHSVFVGGSGPVGEELNHAALRAALIAGIEGLSGRASGACCITEPEFASAAELSSGKYRSDSWTSPNRAAARAVQIDTRSAV